tara:strand:- start:1030 stop:1299 length:270 start_codon:yes stop_codon:yes gene_type:complete
MSVNFTKLAPMFAVCVGASSAFINYGAYSQTLKDLHLKVEAQEKKINSVDIITNELGHLKGSINEIKNNLKIEFADIKVDIKDIKQKMR